MCYTRVRLLRHAGFIGVGAITSSLVRPLKVYARANKYDMSRFDKLDKIDTKIVDQEHLIEFNNKFPKFAGKIISPTIVDEMLDIDYFYRKPLSAERRIHLRRRIKRILDENVLSDEVVALLLEFLESYDSL
jgi:hypothetical protein